MDPSRISLQSGVPRGTARRGIIAVSDPESAVAELAGDAHAPVVAVLVPEGKFLGAMITTERQTGQPRSS
jgi:hypothetical protein